MQVIHLLRDPRAIIKSREVGHWDAKVNEAWKVCKNLERDLQLADILPPER